MSTQYSLLIVGGIGIFLFGMSLITDGLRTLAGDSLRKALSRFTGGTVSSFISGVSITAIIQSSGATMFATIGFVSAGLITFEQSIGVILGANVGTTSTSWIVTYLGFKLKMSAISYPAIAIGALLKLLGDHRKSAIGVLIVGFGMIFLGIDFLQDGMRSIANSYNFTSYSYESLSGKLGLIAAGIIVTILMQSSSAAMASTLAALNANAIAFPQAAILVIGQNIGTTFISALGAIGATIPAKRTALSHILFNIFVGVAVFMFLPFFITISVTFSNFVGHGEPIIALSAFHTLFNLAGSIVVLPFTKQFAKLITKILPERGINLTKNLDNSVLMVPEIALEAVRRTLVGITGYVLDSLAQIFNKSVAMDDFSMRIETAEQALGRTKIFLRDLRSFNNSPLLHARHTNIIHSIEHLHRLLGACREMSHLENIIQNEELLHVGKLLIANAEAIHLWITGLGNIELKNKAEQTSKTIAEIRKNKRKEILEKTSSGYFEAEEAFQLIEQVRMLDRIAFHIWRAILHLEDINTPVSPQTITAGINGNGTT
ncbi:MAG: Na/Pi symporter [Spirochaetes bacterium]|nr:Na/Pi symporter [Spirochaetota bacterium]